MPPIHFRYHAIEIEGDDSMKESRHMYNWNQDLSAGHKAA